MSEINVNELNNIAGGAGNDIPATYTVVPGDNLSKIAAKFKTETQRLTALSPISRITFIPVRFLSSDKLIRVRKTLLQKGGCKYASSFLLYNRKSGGN